MSKYFHELSWVSQRKSTKIGILQCVIWNVLFQPPPPHGWALQASAQFLMTLTDISHISLIKI